MPSMNLERLALVAFVVVVVIVLIKVLGGCGGTSMTLAKARTGTALDLLADTVDPAYELAMNGCVALERVERDAELEGKQAQPDTDAHLAAIRKRCDAVRSVFETIRVAHGNAVNAYRAGDLEQAERFVEDARAGWHELAEVSP